MAFSGSAQTQKIPAPEAPKSVRLSSVLCVDLDGTLVATNTLWESLLYIILRKPAALLAVIASLFKGKANFKAVVAQYASLHVDRLPYRPDLLRYLKEQKSAGRRLALVTAAHKTIADKIAEHLGLFDYVLATTADRNLRGGTKGEALAAEFRDSGFSYAGNSHVDMRVWQHAAAAIPVSSSTGLISRIPIQIEKHFHTPVRPLWILFNALRVHQWVKNLLVFVPLLTSHDFTNLPAIARGFVAMLALSLTASAQYLLNDLIDLDEDRVHPTKKRRALASGCLPIPVALLFVPGLLIMAFSLGWFGGTKVLLLQLAAYFVSSILYSAFFKTKPLVDVFMLSGIYSFRIVIGGSITDHTVTIWLLTFAFLFFLSLAFLKRYVEATRGERTSGSVGRRGYYASEASIIMAMGLGSCFASNVVLALYVNSAAASQVYARPIALWGIVPLGLLIQCRLWLSGSRGYIPEDPVRYMICDRVAWAVGLIGLAIYMAAIG